MKRTKVSIAKMLETRRRNALVKADKLNRTMDLREKMSIREMAEKYSPPVQSPADRYQQGVIEGLERALRIVGRRNEF